MPHPGRRTYITEIHDTHLTKRTDNLTANLVGNVELGQGHVRRAEQGLALTHHGHLGPEPGVEQELPR